MSDIFEQARAVAPRVVDHAVKSLAKATRTGDEWSARCPFHDDDTPSFRMNATTGQFFCHGCGAKGDIIGFYQKLDGLTPAEAAALVVKLGGNGHATTAPAPRQKIESRPATDAEVQKLHDRLSREQGFHSLAPYRDAPGRCLFAVARHEPKKIRPWYITPDGDWKQGQPLENGRPLLWLPAIVAAPGAAVVIVEGEKDAAAARSHVKALGRSDILVSTWSGGASAWRRTDFSPLHGRRVMLMPDNDEPGRKAAEGIAELLRSHSDIYMVEPHEGAKPGEGAADIDAATFGAMIDAATPWRPRQSAHEQLSIVGDDIETPGQKYWRPIREHIASRAPGIDFSQYHITEDSAGRLFVDLVGDYFRSNSTISGFMVWTGTRWTPDRWRLAERAATMIGELYQAQLAVMGTGSIREAASFVKKIRSSFGIKALLFFAASDPRITTTQEDFDQNPDLLNTPAGTIEFPSGILREHRRADLITRCTRYAPESRPSTYFDELMDKITLDREDLKEGLQRFFGSGCSGRHPKEELGQMHGKGSNCKSVLVEAVGDVLGDYAAAIDIKQLVIGEREAAGHNDQLATMHGVRYARSSETNETVKLDEAKIKKYTGGDTVPVSFKHGRTFMMRPCFTLAIVTNHRFKISGRDTGIWRRIKLYPFDYQIPDAEKDLQFKSKLLAADGPVILQWLIDGARLWYDSGYGKFETVESATAAYRVEEDVVGRFIDEECTLSESAEVGGSVLSEAFKQWCLENNERFFAGRAWGEALRERGIERVHRRTGKAWRGIALKSQIIIEEGQFDDELHALI